MNGYKLSIKKNDQVISFSTDPSEYIGSAPITSVIFKMNTINEETLNRSDRVRAEMVINGRITEQNKEETLKLALWSKDNDRNTLYRDVELTVYADRDCTGKILRFYKFSTMFVIDYEENFPDEANTDLGYFKLFIAQKDGKETKDIYAE